VELCTAAPSPAAVNEVQAIDHDSKTGDSRQKLCPSGGRLVSLEPDAHIEDLAYQIRDARGSRPDREHADPG
jgi:hypothetical protein